MTQIIGPEDQVANTSDLLIRAGDWLRGELSEIQFTQVKFYAAIYAAAQLERVAMVEHRAGRHTLAKQFLQQALLITKDFR